MFDEIIECFVHPVRSRLLLELLEKGPATAKQLSAAVPDVKQATLYRHLKKMEACGILRVVSENRVRGAVERVYALRQDLPDEGNRLLRERPGETYLSMYASFSLQLMREFRAYCARPDVDILKDGTGFSVCPICASLEEIQEASIEIGKILARLGENAPAPGRRLHSVALIITPPKEENERGDAED